MTIKIAINGFGRIGRNILRALYEENARKDMVIVAVNDLTDINTMAHLLKYDSIHGRFRGTVTTEGNDLVVNGDKIHYYAEKDPSNLPWRKLGVDVVMECTGLFTERDKAALHLKAGARKVLISAPAGKDVDATIVYGVNHQILKPEHTIVSNASCTTNCITPLVKPLHEALKIKRGLMVTIHAYTNDQRLTDSPHKDLHRARAAAVSLIPTKTGAAAAVGLVLPELAGKLDGYAIRVPVANVSIVDLTFETDTKTSVDAVNKIVKDASEGALKGILNYNCEPLVSIDFNHSSASSTFDATQTRVIDAGMVKVVSWYDNEWGFSCRMIDVSRVLGKN